MIDLEKILEYIYNYSFQRNIQLKLDKEALNLYDDFHEDIIDFRKQDRFEESKLSVKSKSLGLVMRLSAIISLLRSSCSKILNESYEHSDIVTGSDFSMAKRIVEISVNTAFAILPDSTNVVGSSGKRASCIRSTPLPDPENLTIDFLKPFHKQVKRIIRKECTPLSTITRDKIYPIINNESGSRVGRKFVNGLEQLGFGKFSPNSKSFKRYSPDSESCPDRENLKKKYKALNIN